MTGGPRVLVVGAGWRFTSGISYYTCRLTNALAQRLPTDALLVRRLVPKALYPGRDRVGQVVNDIAYDPTVTVLEGLDWYWGASMTRSRRFLQARGPDVVILQWWTGATLHSYLRLALLARRRGAKVVMEWHEVQDTGEARIPGVTRYVRAAMGLLLRRVDAHVVHSAHDLELLEAAYGLRADTHDVTVVPHGPYDHVGATPAGDGGSEDGPDGRRAPEKPFTLLFFGIIRPYKGLEDLVEAFSSLPDDVREHIRLRIVGETWEGWDTPLQAVAASAARDRIDVVNRYVTDAEVREHFAQADAVVLPYRRSSASGPLHMAMSAGLPVVVTAVGGLVDAAGDYEGVTFVPPEDTAALAEALRALPAQRGRRYTDPHTWERSVEAYLRVFTGLGLTVSAAVAPAPVTPEGVAPDDVIRRPDVSVAS
ncbi:MAG: glycosyltransferase [Actinomycetota bacterium]|nr:glycosyltransferase [Actinomycetota bacterium]